MILNKYISILLLLICLSLDLQGKKPFTFVQICDTQFGMGGYENDVKSFEQAVKQINALQPDLVLICGDLVDIPNDSTYADFKRIMKGFRMPCYCVPGNHDVGSTPTPASLNYYRKTIGKDYYSFRKNGYSFMALNTQLWKASVQEESEKHDRWFKETLKRAGKKYPIIVFGHIPLYAKDIDEKEVYFNIAHEKRKELLGLMEQSNVKLYLSGHSHTLIINNYKGIQLVSGETTSRNFDKRPLGFRLWNISEDDSIKHNFIPLD